MSDLAAAPARLLVADDNKVNRLLLTRNLELLGHTVASAENGRVALEMLRRERFDVVLLDMEMPELDGFAVLEAMKGDLALRDTPVIVTSSLEGLDHVVRCIELGAEDYLPKPVNPVLLKYINRLSDLLYVFARVDEQCAIRGMAESVMAGVANVGTKDGGVPLPLSQTEAMVQRGMRRAAEIGVPMVLAVVDANGDLLQMRRMDGALIISVTLAPHKAYTAAIVRMSTEEFAAAAQPGGSLFGIDVNMPKMTLVGGGIPVLKNGVVVGAVGVSGGSVAQDVDVAKAMVG